MSFKNIFRRGSTRREDVYKVEEAREEEDNGKSLGVSRRAERRSERNEEKKQRRNERCASAGAGDSHHRETHYPVSYLIKGDKKDKKYIWFTWFPSENLFH